MTDQDAADFATLMLGLGETYGEPVSDARIEIYFAALSDMTLPEIRAAATAHVRGCKFFPRPAELREGLDGSAEDRAELAWLSVMRIVRAFGFYNEPPPDAWMDEATRRAALDLYGGWRGLCSRLPAEGPEMLGAAKLFKGGYRAYENYTTRRELPHGESGRELSDGEALRSLTVALKARGLPTYDS
jgi:hypothetical protein